jgi:hypothetical protein
MLKIDPHGSGRKSVQTGQGDIEPIRTIYFN